MASGSRYLPYPVLAQRDREELRRSAVEVTSPRKVRVGVVGEILVKYQPDANNHVVDVIESQDCEAVVPGIMEFMTTRPYITDWNEKYLGTGGNKTLYALDASRASTCYNAPIKAAPSPPLTASSSKTSPMPELVEKAAEVTSIGVQAGEGWLLTAEILELIEQGCPNCDLRAAVRLPAEPCDRPRHVRQDPPPAPGGQHRVHRLRSGRLRGEPAQPHQADDRGREEGAQGEVRRRLTSRRASPAAD